MITEQATLTGRNQRSSEASGLRWRMAGWIGLAAGILLIAAVLVASRIAGPLASFGVAQSKAEPPTVGRSVTVTGLVYDGTRYTNAPIAVGAPKVGRGYAVTGLVYDGTSYRAVPVQVGGR
jgi:hypothetical protein